MDIKYTVKLTEIRFTSPPYLVPTIEIEAPQSDNPAKAAVMAAAHRMAAALWAQNAEGLDIEITPPHNGVATVTLDVGRDEDAQQKALALMSTIVPTKPTAKGKIKPADQPQA